MSTSSGVATKPQKASMPFPLKERSYGTMTEGTVTLPFQVADRLLSPHPIRAQEWRRLPRAEGDTDSGGGEQPGD